MGLFGKKYSLSDLPSFNKTVLLDCLDLVIKSGIGDQYKPLEAAAKTGKLTKKQLKECGSFAGWYKDLVASQPNLAATFGESSYKATITALQGVEDYVKGKL